MTEKNSPGPKPTGESDGTGRQEYLPPLDFSSIVLPLFTQALLKLDFFKEAEKTPAEPNLELARRLIDILDLLKDRTKGNLSLEEEKFLDSCLQQLKAVYLEKSKIINT